MSKPLPLEDFRAVRIVLEDDDFALVPEDGSRPPADIVDRDTWNSIVTLPDDVSIRTSNDHGQLLRGMDRCWEAFVDSLSFRRDPIETAILDAADEFHAATYNSLHGFYRQAFGCLRNALESIAIATYCQVTGQKALFRERERGKTRIEFGRACDGLITASHVAALRTRLRNELGDSLFDQRKGTHNHGGWARRLFSDLSEYEHCRPKFRNADLWCSNGPVFSPTAFTRLAASFFETAALSFLMIKLGRPRFSLPERAIEIWESKIIKPSRIAVLAREILY